MTEPAKLRRRAAFSPVEELKSYILGHRLRPGDPLPSETELCAEIGVSRSSIREAMRTLVSLDIVEVRHGYGSFVGQLSLAPLVSGLVFRSTLNTEGEFRTLSEVLSLRRALDLGVAEDLAELHPSDSGGELRELVQQMRERTTRGESFAEEDGRFHALLIERLDNVVLKQLVAAFWQVHTTVVPALGIPPAEDIRDTVEAHEAMLDALEAGDVEGYREAVEAHYRPLQRAIDGALAARSADQAAATGQRVR